MQVPSVLAYFDKIFISLNFLQVLDQELNMTRRANRPFVPEHHQNYYSLQRQVQDMEQPIETPRRP